MIDLFLLLKNFNFKKKILYLIKSKNNFGRFYKNIYTIEYQKYSLPYIYLFIFLNVINKNIYVKFLIVETNLTNEFIRIITLIIFYGLYRKLIPTYLA